MIGFNLLLRGIETATYGLVFNAAWTATEQVMDLRYSLHMLGVPIMESVMFGDNQRYSAA
jgi:hypothetical protein